MGVVVKKASDVPRLPEQGYHGKHVAHENLKTVTKDWAQEYGPKEKETAAVVKETSSEKADSSSASTGGAGKKEKEKEKEEEKEDSVGKSSTDAGAGEQK